ncbi:hypothetical protein [Pseudidiomarina insulisalsae]|nr:hypothetical protein [Pseudidiomarina insulisalsae]
MSHTTMTGDTQPQGERRRSAFDPQQWWQRLTMDQKFGVYQLNKFGFELAFIRNLPTVGPLAVVRRNQEYATVNKQGEVDLKPQITIRN